MNKFMGVATKEDYAKAGKEFELRETELPF